MCMDVNRYTDSTVEYVLCAVRDVYAVSVIIHITINN